LATEYQTRYVSAEKLSKVKIPTDVLDRVPVRMAEANGIIPIMFEPERKVMSVVMAEPQNTAVVTELRIVGGLSEVFVFVGTRTAINAAVKKHYYGDPTAFEQLENAPPPTPVPTEAGAVADFVEHASRADPKGPPADALRLDATPKPRPVSLQRAAAEGRAVTQPGTSPTSVRQAAETLQRSSLLSDNDFVETLNVLIGLLEMRRKDAFRSHSATVAKHSRTIAQRLGLGHREVSHITVAAYLHDLGKRHDRHLTLLAATAKADWRADAKRYYKAPTKLFETVHLPAEVNGILAQLYEAFDGSGMPQGVKGEAIPAGSRSIAAVDSFEDLVKNPQNVFGEVFPKARATQEVTEKSGSLFDPAVVDVMLQIHSGDILRGRLLSEGRQAIICHRDEGIRTDLRDALSKLGLLANVATSSDGVLEGIRGGEVDLIVTEANSKPTDAVTVIGLLRAEPATSGVPVILLVEKADPALADRAAGMGAVVLMPEDGDPSQIAIKAKELLGARVASGAPGRTVAGLLDEMGIEDLLRTIASAKRSGRLQVRAPGKVGEIFIDQGRVVHSIWGAIKGEAAFDLLVVLTDGDFSLDPNFLILDQEMDKDVELLLRESSVRRRRQAGNEAAAKVPLAHGK
jgi:response regulator RpfG family c-di-GMP phosphodiesterase